MSPAVDAASMKAASAARWRILVVDDSADDAELIGIELMQGGIDAELRCVDGETTLLAALATFTPQLVLSDMNMPGFSGDRALNLVREHAPGTQFVFLSGDAGGEFAVDKGAVRPDARLSKDHLGRLPALVRGLLGD
ncbi:MAG: response regulator [Pseudomonadota bacterium]|nr:response regulator [Pseudomonadota bacterium]